MSVESSITLSDLAKTFYDRFLLERLLADLPHLAFADPGRVVTLGKGQGKSIEWRRWNALPLATVPLQPGVTPSGSNTSITVISGTPQQYGDFTTYTDELDMVSIDPVVMEYMQLFSEQAATSLDTVAREVQNGGTNVQYAGGVAGRSSVAASNKMSTTEIDKGVRTLENANVPKIRDDFGGSFLLFVHPNTKFDIRADSRWQAVDQYAGGTKTYSGEVGRWNGCRIVVSTNCKVFAGMGSGGIDVYSSLMFGAHWFGIGRWADMTGGQKATTYSGLTIEVFIKALGSAGAADPLNQRGTIGWKASQLVKLLNQLCGLRIEHAVS